MERRKFIIGAGSAAIGGSALLGSGAFTRVEAQRRAKVQVAQDPDAYLGLDGCPESPNSSYTHLDEKGHLAIEMSPDNPTEAGGQGINSDSRTWFHRVFQICNQGKQTVCVWIGDHEDWPRVVDADFPDDDYSAYDGDRRVDFYVEDDSERSIVGFENHVTLEVGDCICVGVKTNSKSLSEGDQILEDFDDEIVIHADAECEIEEEPCPVLDGRYECTTYEPENGEWVRTGTRFRVENEGDATTFDLAVADQPSSWRGGVPIGADTTRSVVTDASVPLAAIIAWDTTDRCREEQGLETWDEFKARVGVDDLTDWYETFGTGPAPAGAPDDLDDETVVEVKDLPEEGKDAEDVIGPDESIDDEIFPDMSQEAEDEGWITCAKFDDD